MKRSLRAIIFLSIFLGTFTSACTLLTNFNPPNYSIDLLKPQVGGVYPVGDGIYLAASGTTPSDGSSVTQVIFYANGASIASSVLDPSSSSTSFSTPAQGLNWTPSSAGEYQMQAMAILQNGRTVVSDASRICVLPIDLTSVSASGHVDYGYNGPCPPPDFITINPSSFTANATPASLTYPDDDTLVGLDRLNCPPPPTTITFYATVVTTPENYALVLVELQAGSSLHETLALSGYINHSTGYYAATTDDLEGELLATTASAITWKAYIVDPAGHVVASTGPYAIPVMSYSAVSCSSVAASPTATTPSIVTPTFSPTPASAQNCPAGTYFAEQTHRCIAIATPTTGSANKICNLSAAICLKQQKKYFDPATCSCK